MVSLGMEEIVGQLQSLGLSRGVPCLVHTSFRALRPVESGPVGLIEALLMALAPEGTLVMPSMTDDDDTPFDALATPCAGMGIVADTFWRRPEVLRSDSPHAFAAFGPAAREITAPHPIDVPHGIDSPVGRVHELDGEVLLIGVGHDANTTIHLAETLSGVRYRRPKYTTILVNGVATRIDYAEIDHCCERFEFVGRWLEERGLQRAGTLGHAPALLARSRDIVRAATEQLAWDETVFLHPPGIDDECDEARSSIPSDTASAA